MPNLDDFDAVRALRGSFVRVRPTDLAAIPTKR